MPDITMCSNLACPKASTCYRSSKSGTKLSMWQSMIDFTPQDRPIQDCQYYWPIYVEK